jgi:hypothetical protein
VTTTYLPDSSGIFSAVQPVIVCSRRAFGPVSLKEGKAKSFFSEEKNQKTFISGASGQVQAMARIVEVAEK